VAGSSAKHWTVVGAILAVAVVVIAVLNLSTGTNVTRSYDRVAQGTFAGSSWRRVAP
jgi:hypothetical protein